MLAECLDLKSLCVEKRWVLVECVVVMSGSGNAWDLHVIEIQILCNGAEVVVCTHGVVLAIVQVYDCFQSL